MNLEVPPRCIMVKLHPMAAKRLLALVRTHFKLDNRRFMNVEGRRKFLGRPKLNELGRPELNELGRPKLD